VEGGSDGVVTFSGAVRWLEAEASEGSAGAASERRRKHSAGEKNPTGDGITLLKGGGGKQRRGSGSRAAHGAERGRKRGPGHGEKRLGRPASAFGRRARATVLPR
jgi:hypothetical protein